jgi:4-carboxymuconolactone decarboxylase
MLTRFDIAWARRLLIAVVATTASIPMQAQTLPGGASMQTPAQRLLGDVNPKLAQLTDDVLFGDVWARPGLSQRDRSLRHCECAHRDEPAGPAAFAHAAARDNGVTEAELVEAITHLAFYAGWPSAVTATTVAREVFQQKR